MRLRDSNLESSEFCENLKISDLELIASTSRFSKSENQQYIFGYGDKCSVNLFDTVMMRDRIVTLDLNIGIKLEDDGLNIEEQRQLKIASIYYISELFLISNEFIENLLSC